MSELRMLKCLNCGAPLDPKTLKCNYCGTYHERTHEGIVHVIKSIPVMTHVVQAKMVLDRYHLLSMPSDELGFYVKGTLTRKIAEEIHPLIEFESCEDIPRQTTICSARLRVVEPDFRF